MAQNAGFVAVKVGRVDSNVDLGAVEVVVYTEDITATDGNDYIGMPKGRTVLSLASGASDTVTINIIPCNLDNTAGETFRVRLDPFLDSVNDEPTQDELVDVQQTQIIRKMLANQMACVLGRSQWRRALKMKWTKPGRCKRR